MADLVITITKNGPLCTIKPNPFKAKQNADVVFDFPGESEGVIDFGDDSPFGDTAAEKKFRPDPKGKKVKAKPRSEPFRYIVIWPGGDGNGSGEIIP